MAHGRGSGRLSPCTTAFFINENVFSDDVVTNEHLKNQYGMIVGVEGVRRVRRIVELDAENRENNSQSQVVEAELNGILRAVGPEGMTSKEFLGLEAIVDVGCTDRIAG